MARVLEKKKRQKEMRKIIYICDKCKKEMGPTEFIRYGDVDLCLECSEHAMDLIRTWINEQEAKPDQEEIPESVPEPETAPESKKEEKKVKKASVKKNKKEIDAGAAQALRDNGWTITRIAKELGCTKTEVNAITHKPPKKRRFANEWAEHEPDLKTDIRIELGEIKPIES